jgi:hypothetical protein
MNGRDELLRAHVFAAFDCRGTDAFPVAVARVVDGWMLWPAIKAELALERARRRRDLHRERIADAVAAIRESYPTRKEQAA